MTQTLATLWYDASKNDLGQIVRDACLNYYKKMNGIPDTCQVHPSMAVENLAEILVVFPNGIKRNIQVLTASNILPHHVLTYKESPAALN